MGNRNDYARAIGLHAGGGHATDKERNSDHIDAIRWRAISSLVRELDHRAGPGMADGDIESIVHMVLRRAVTGDE